MAIRWDWPMISTSVLPLKLRFERLDVILTVAHSVPMFVQLHGDVVAIEAAFFKPVVGIFPGTGDEVCRSGIVIWRPLQRTQARYDAQLHRAAD